jgi:NLR family CARD domain-containing protein 3
MSLELLDVGFNSIGTDGGKALMGSLATNTSLQSLTLSGNTLDREGASAVAAAVAANGVLKELYLDHTAIGHEGQSTRRHRQGIVRKKQHHKQ